MSDEPDDTDREDAERDDRRRDTDPRADVPGGDDPEHEPGGGDKATDDADGGEDEAPVDPDDAAPLSDLASEVDEGDLAETEQELFEQRSAPGIDREALWRQVADEETAERAIEEMDVEDDGPQVRHPDRGDSVDTGERVVAKNSYCHSCRFFSPPPDVHCSHEGTEILEAVDMDHFRVKDCPIVQENEDLEEF